MRGSLLIYLLVAGCICTSMASADTPPVPIEGNLWVSGYQSGGASYAYYLHGTSDQVTVWPGQIEHADISPLGDALVYQVTAGAPYTATGDIWVTSLDGSTNTDVSQAAGLSGVNCFPSWSPDASQIAFRHADPSAGQQPCDAGFAVWVMGADGTDARRVSPDDIASIRLGGWSADGRRLVCALEGAGAVTLGLDGSDPQALPNLRGEGADFSPDGRQVAGRWDEDDVVDGEPGAWRELVVTDPDGGNPHVLVREFIKHSDAEAMVARLGLEPAAEYVADLEWRIGPLFPQWSPTGDRIAFLAALPFDPNGPDYREQVEVWIYTLSTGDLTRITEDTNRDVWLSWSGENTFADDPQVTVATTTITFSEVVAPGLTTILWEGSPPGLPTPYRPVGDCYRLHTTALVTGPADVAMGYDAAAVPDAAEGHLKLLRYDEGTAQWEDITVSRDFTNHVIHGGTDTLGLMRLAWPLPESDFSDVSDSATDPFWALWEIQAACDAGIVQGYPGGTYHPAEAVSRAQMAVYIARALAGGDAGVPASPTTVSFPDDVPADHWACRYVEYAVGAGVVQGYDATHYRPDTIVTRDQMAVFVARAKQWVSVGEAMNTAPELFSDVAAGFWCGTAVQACVAHGVVNGYPDGTYHPEREVTRDQMAVYVARAFALTM
jgi:hypothetical protein